MALPPSAVDWMNRAEIDYIGPFVKAWAAFNAWYRHASGEVQERAMLEHVKRQPNQVRRAILPLLDTDNRTADSVNLKQAVYDLHHRLDAIRFEVTRRNKIERISLRAVCISPQPMQGASLEKHKQEYRADGVQGGGIRVAVKSLRTGQTKFVHTQGRYDPDEVYALRSFADNLTSSQQATLRRFYDGCNPRPMHDLVQGDGPPLIIATMQFRCHPEDLLFGLVEVIYTMRNALLHGEVEPDTQVLACYEPAYRIVMQFLACIR